MDNVVHGYVIEKILKMGILVDHQLNLGSQWRLYAQFYL